MDSNGVRKPRTKIPEIKPLKAIPGKTNTESLKSPLNITLRKIMKTSPKTACMIEAKTMSIRLSIFITILEEETQTARVKRAGTIWKEEAPKTPIESKSEKKRAEVCPKRIAIRNEQKTDGIITGRVYGFWNTAFFIPKEAAIKTRMKRIHSRTTSFNSTCFRRRTGLKSTIQRTEIKIK